MPGVDAPTGPTQVRGVGCEEPEKTWRVVWGINPQEGQRGLGTIPIARG